ncbi:HvfC/BufC N-terminal domain-containing protein [Chachezhania sediminis]|uniref:HvfC/BufC N-terminal domain-containing protein n=1 Tax=Chachezhania sediminis TaxID=2599291 RepID=UPI001E351EAF|nr:DNA-binding domain-containing protein [Chachezhania sediminis]
MGVTEAAFAAALLRPQDAAPSGLRNPEDAPAGRRFDVYRNNVVAGLSDALSSGFPTVASLLGPEAMTGLSRLYLQDHLPVSPIMARFGTDFPDFLGAVEQLRSLAYLPDIARLDLARRQSYHAADADHVTPEVFAAVPGDRLARVTLAFAPAVRLLRSPWPIHAIWLFNTEDDAPAPQAGAQDVLISRPDFDPVVDLLPPGGAAWIAALAAGTALGPALDNVQAQVPAFDFAPILALLLQRRAISILTITE